MTTLSLIGLLATLTMVTLSMMTLRIIVIPSITTYGMMTLSMTSSFVMLNVVNAEHCFFIVMLRISMLNVITVIVTILRVLAPNEWTGYD